MSTPRPLVVLAHGTRDPAGREVIERVVGLLTDALPGVSSSLGYVDVCEPGPAEALRHTDDAVVIPLFLTTGYHVRVDVADAVAGHGRGAAATPALTRHPGVRAAVADRAGLGRNAADAPNGSADPDRPEAAVLVGAGTSDPGAHAEVAEVAAALAGDAGIPVRAGYLSGLGPRPDEVIAALRDAGAARVAALSFLIAPGVFQTKLERLPADQFSPPIGAHPALITALVDRYHEGVGVSGWAGRSVERA